MMLLHLRPHRVWSAFIPLLLIALTIATLPWVVVSAAATYPTNNNAKEGDGSIKKRICLIPASFPWYFGPYQSQMYKVSLLLSQRGYTILWMPRSLNSALPEGVYKDWTAVQKHSTKSIPPPKNFQLDHITFVGRGKAEELSNRGLYSGNSFFASELNHLAELYQIDFYFTLMDLVQLIPDTTFTKPVVGWVPLHTAHVNNANGDIWTLKAYHGIAALAPSGVSAIQKAVLSSYLPVEFVPHIINRIELETLAEAGLDVLRRTTSIKVADVVIAKEGKRATPAAASAAASRHARQRNTEPNRFFSGKDDDTFLVLLQGGNYDELDRKGWDTSIQAYAEFRRRYFSSDEIDETDDENNDEDDDLRPKLIGTHLYLHAIESYIVEQESNSNNIAPPQIRPKGIVLTKRLYESSNIPREGYTLDITQHEPEIVYALKSRANVCLHPSKVEGFGMNVMECQALGTPVITTNFTAMGDFTKLGIATPYRQMQYLPAGGSGSGYELAMPDVHEIANALGKLYEEHVRLRGGRKVHRSCQADDVSEDDDDDDDGDDDAIHAARKELVDQTKRWIDEEFSERTVADKIMKLIHLGVREAHRRDEKRKAMLAVGMSPKKRYFEFAMGDEDHLDVVDHDAPWTLIAPEGRFVMSNEKAIEFYTWAVIEQEMSNAAVMVLPATYTDTEEPVPLFDFDGNVHPDLPILIRTYIITTMQHQMSRRSSIVYFSINHAQSINALRRMPDGFAKVYRA